MANTYAETDKMCDLISEEHRLLQMMSRFGIQLGVGEKTIREVCDEYQVDCRTFLAVANFISRGADHVPPYVLEQVSVSALMTYLMQAHTYFLSYQLPAIRRKLIEALDCSMKNDVAFLILKFYDEYMNEVRRHMEFENSKIFTYVEKLQKGAKVPNYEIAQFAKNHESIDIKLQELKNIIIKYYTPQGDANLLNMVMFDIFNCAEDLALHCQLENMLFVPAVQQLEKRVAAQRPSSEAGPDKSISRESENLSEREREIVGCIVRGMANKEIADKLFISVNTVLTHRKNITRKLKIHSVSGLTIYAIVNKLVNLEEVKAI